MVRHLASVAEIVEDLPAAVTFYRETLGVEVKEQTGDDYAVLVVPGVLHFAVWSRSHAALSIYGDRGAAERVPLGFTLEFEVEDMEHVSGRVSSSQYPLIHSPKTEPWNQTTCRGHGPGGGILGFALTPWARRLKQLPEAEAGD